MLTHISNFCNCTLKPKIENISNRERSLATRQFFVIVCAEFYKFALKKYNLHLFINGMSDRTLNVNTAAAEELKRIQGDDVNIAQLILWFIEIRGFIWKEALILALQGNMSPDVLDFSVPMMK